MKNTFALLAILPLCAGAISSHAQATLPDPMPGPATSAGYYYENKGQIIDEAGAAWPSIQYYSEKGRARLYFAANKVHHTLRIPGDSVVGALAPDTAARLDVRFDCGDERGFCGKFMVREESQDFLNYFLPHCGPNGITGVKGYKTVMYQNAFPGIDVRYTADASGPVMYFVVKPGANPADIKLVMAGHDSLLQYVGGSLRAALGQQSILFPKGTVYQIDASGNPYIIPSWFANWFKVDDSTVSLSTGSYNTADQLVIKIANPPITTGTTAAGQKWGTYYDEANISGEGKIAVETGYTGTSTPPDADVALYAVQDQQGSTFQPQAGFQTLNFGGQDFYISRFDGGYVRKWATYYGGSGDERVEAVALKPWATDRFYITGRSASTNLFVPSPNSGTYYQANGPTMLAEFDKSNGHPKWITKIGGTGTVVSSIDIDNVDGKLYLAGSTENTGTTGCSAPTGNTFPLCAGSSGRFFQNNVGIPAGARGFVMELNTANNSLEWSTFIGWKLYLHAVKKYNSPTVKKLYIGGATSNDVSITYSTAITSQGSNLADRTPLVNPSGGAYLQNTFLYNTNPLQDPQKVEGYVAAFNGNFELEWGSYFGGDLSDAIYSMTTLPGGDLVIAGTTATQAASSSSTTANTGGDFPLYDNPATNDYYQPIHGSVYAGLPSVIYTDNFIARFGTAHELKWSTYFGDAGSQGVAGLGTSLYDYSPVVSSDAVGNIFLAGASIEGASTLSNLPLPVASLSGLYNQPTNASAAEALEGEDAYFAYFNPVNSPRWVTYFGGDGLSPTGSTHPNRADEYFGDMAVLSAQRMYAMVSTKSENTPDECPQAGPTGQPYCDDSYSNFGDVFLTAFDYSQHATGIANGASASDAFALQAAPNPTDGRTTVQYFSGARRTVHMNLVDLLGKTVMAYDIPSAPGANRFTIDLTGVSTGVYHLQLSNTEGHGAIKIVKQ